MILFEEDWELYPTAKVHLSTKNESWLRMAKVYRSMGVSNHTFLLALINPHLEFIDPHDPFLTQDERDMITAECRINPWYYFREVARIPGQVGTPPIPVEANRGNIATWWLIFNHVTMILIQPRQTGKSYTIYELEVYLMDILCEGTLINLYTKDEKLRKEAIDIIKAIFDALPEYLDLRNKRTDANNTEQITVNALKNKLNTFLPRSSEKDANNVARGFGAPFNHIDEGPFCTNSHISIPAMLSAGNAVRDRAKDAGTPYCNILTTTAGKLDTPEGGFIHSKYILESMPWSESLLDRKNVIDLEEYVRRNNHNRYQVSVIMSHRQLGKTDAWLAEKMEESKSAGDAADRDYFNVWTSGTIRHPLSPALLKRIVASKNEKVYHHLFPKQKYMINWNVSERNLETYLANNKLILGADTSSASNGDDIGLVWTDARTLDVAGTATINETNILTFANWLAIHLVENPNVTLVIERRSTGESIIDILLSILPAMGVDPFKRIFNLVVQDKDENRDRFAAASQPMGRRDENFYTLNKTAFGFATAGSGRFSRSMLYGNTMQNAAKRSGSRVYAEKLIEQIVGLEEKNGRVDHKTGGHDDLVIAWLLTHWFLSDGKHMDYYGIKEIMTMIDDQKELTEEERYAMEIQREIQNQIMDLSKMLEDTSDQYMAEKLEQRMRLLAQGLVFQDSDFTNVDQLLKDIAERKKKRHQQIVGNRSNDTPINDMEYYNSVRGFGGYNPYR